MVAKFSYQCLAYGHKWSVGVDFIPEINPERMDMIVISVCKKCGKVTRKQYEGRQI